MEDGDYDDGDDDYKDDDCQYDDEDENSVINYDGDDDYGGGNSDRSEQYINWLRREYH